MSLVLLRDIPCQLGIELPLRNPASIMRGPIDIGGGDPVDMSVMFVVLDRVPFLKLEPIPKITFVPVTF